jgi:5-(carboxyamino)imidazole ribonucleotide mutase
MIMSEPLVGVIMGSTSDWEIVKHCVDTLDELGIANEVKVISAHRTPDLHDEWTVEAEKRGMKVIIAAAGGAAHLAGVTAAKTTIPVLGIPMKTSSLGGLDSLLSIVQMPAGIPVGTLAIGRAGAINSALLAAAIISLSSPEVHEALKKYRANQTEKVAATPDPRTL